MRLPREQVLDFRSRFGSAPRVFQAPGRVNLIGEHTDYNEGFVLPFAIELITRVAAAPRDDRIVRVWSVQAAEQREFKLDDRPPEPRGEWLDYVEGTARVLEANGARLSGADLWIEGDVPLGAGLSSSASLELATGLALVTVAGLSVAPLDLARAAQQAEHRFVGTRCGIMDQLVSALGQAGAALLIDCRSLSAVSVPLALPGTALVVCDTRVKHSLASSAYNQRRRECEEGVAELQRGRSTVAALRDVSHEFLESRRSQLREIVYRRCRHVVTEDKRTLEAVEALKAGNVERLGQLLSASHASLRDDYQVSSPELDLAVQSASRIEGVLGARMTGGGFGGSTLTLVKRNSIEKLRQALEQAFQRAGFARPVLREVEASPGMREITTA